MANEKFVTTVKICVPSTGVPHVDQTTAQNLASSAVDLKAALKSLTDALSLETLDTEAALENLFAALCGDKKDPKVYEVAVKRARADYEAVKKENLTPARKVAAALDNAVKVLHESNCVTDMPPLPVADVQEKLDLKREPQSIDKSQVGSLDDLITKKK